MAVVIDGSNGISSPDYEVDGVTGQIYPLVSGTAVTASGTAVNFTGIPSWAKRITVMLSGVSLSTTASSIVLQLGSGSIETTGYVGGYGVSNSLGSATASTFTNYFYAGGLSNISETMHGALTLYNVSGNIWVCSGTLFRDGAIDAGFTITGSKTTSGVLDRIQVSLTSTGAFDAGTINIIYE